MSTRPTRPARRWPAAEWWAPLVTDLAAIQRGSASLGFVVRRISLAETSPSVQVDWPDGTGTVLRPDPEAGVPALLDALGVAGPTAPPPHDHDALYWAPGPDASPLLRYAWLLDQLGTASDAWYAYAPTPVDLLEIRTDATETADITVGRPDHSDAVRVRVSLTTRTEATGIGYAVVERALETESTSPLAQEPVAGLPTRQVRLRET
ncbi:hypothetical protein ABZ614_09390 [Streptomyces sp. NPDC013178]|uniref:hypothetical protein n=1 Tax=Streptomyces sp. NPDC013178 TaxID=3155118 RepID=UPI0033D62B0B